MRGFSHSVLMFHLYLWNSLPVINYKISFENPPLLVSLRLHNERLCPLPFLHLQKRRKSLNNSQRSGSFQSFPIKQDDRCALLYCCRTSWWRRSSCSRTSLGKTCTLWTGWPWAWFRTGKQPLPPESLASQHSRDIAPGEAGAGESFSLVKISWSATDPFFLHWNPRGLLTSLELFIHYSSFLSIYWTVYSLPSPSFQY